MDAPSSTNKAIIGILVVVLIAIAATAVIVTGIDHNPKEAEAAGQQRQSSSKSSSVNSQVAQEANQGVVFKDGTYSAQGIYQTPGGREAIDVTVTLAQGAIIDAGVEQKARGGEAAEYQSKFVSAYKSQVIGKKINEVNLSRIAGSSLTPNGFNNAIQEIENQAKV